MRSLNVNEEIHMNEHKEVIHGHIIKILENGHHLLAGDIRKQNLCKIC